MKLDPPSNTNSDQTEAFDALTLADEEAENLPTSNPQPPAPNLRRIGAIITVWLALVVAAWFAIHRPFSIEVPYVPFSSEIPLAIGGTLATVGLLALMLLASTLLG